MTQLEHVHPITERSIKYIIINLLVFHYNILHLKDVKINTLELWLAFSLIFRYILPCRL